MIKKEYYKACDISIIDTHDKLKEEFFNDYGYNLSSNRKKEVDHFKDFCTTKQNILKEKPKI